jgi:ABC-type multidrug transport system ATPase subunit
MIEVRDLVKKYDEVTAVGGVPFDVSAGEILALLGPNGATRRRRSRC